MLREVVKQSNFGMKWVDINTRWNTVSPIQFDPKICGIFAMNLEGRLRRAFNTGYLSMQSVQSIVMN